jgi:hypothetical protein
MLRKIFEHKEVEISGRLGYFITRNFLIHVGYLNIVRRETSRRLRRACPCNSCGR